MSKELRQALSKYLADIGRKGARKQAKTHSKADFVRWGKMGGRPPKKKAK
jgi:hypothetical protein